MHLAGKPAEQCSEGLRQRQGGGGIGKAVGEGRERRRWFTPEGWYPSLCTSQIRLKPCRHVLHFGFSWGYPGRRDGDPRPPAVPSDDDDECVQSPLAAETA